MLRKLISQSEADLMGQELHELARKLFPINRSLTGEGVRASLLLLKEFVGQLEIESMPTGKKVFDWTIPQEWKVNAAYVADSKGNKVIDFNENNLHLVGYSEAFRGQLSYSELVEHLHVNKKLPSAIPYVTSYYAKSWGFCLPYNEFINLDKNEIYDVVVDTEHFNGEMNYASLLISGKSEKEVLISTYICHPSMANNELSGPLVSCGIIKTLLENQKSLYYSYRFVFVPETIGAIAYISKNLKELKEKVIAGYVLTCIGDERNYSYLSSRLDNTLSDKVGKHVLKSNYPGGLLYNYLHRGSDERQYCSPGVDLPMGSLMRTKYGEYIEYHTSLDNLDLVTSKGLSGSFEYVMNVLNVLDNNHYYKSKVLCEPQLGKRGLYPNISSTNTDYSMAFLITNFLAYADSNHDLVDIAERLGVSALQLLEVVDTLKNAELIEVA